MKIRKRVPLAEYSTLKIGGPAEYFITVRTPEEINRAFEIVHSKKLPYFILGYGSNCLFDDRGFRGVIIHNRIEFCNQTENAFHVGSGMSLSHFAQETVRQSLGGLEFAAAIPGSIGGAITMNASAHGQEISKVVKSVDFVDLNGTLHTFFADQMEFSYRTSSFQRKQGAIISAHILLYHSPLVFLQLKKFLSLRKKEQPLFCKSAGCVFRNPKKGLSAGYLIEQCGLKGINKGGAMISPKHANFIINKKGATAQDVLFLIDLIQKKVAEKFDISLQLEVCYLPYAGKGE